MSPIAVLDQSDVLSRRREFDSSLLPSGPRLAAEPMPDDDDFGIFYLLGFQRGATRLKFKEPLKIEVRPGDDVRFSAFAPFIDVGGVGESRELAIADLLSTAFDVRDSFRETKPAKLHGSAVELLARLERVLGR